MYYNIIYSIKLETVQMFSCRSWTPFDTDTLAGISCPQAFNIRTKKESPYLKAQAERIRKQEYKIFRHRI